MLLSGPVSSSIRRATVPILQIKHAWADDWQTAPELRLLSMTRQAGSGAVDTADFARSYGQVKLPWESSPSARTPWPSLTGWWVRVVLCGGGNTSVEFVGRIEANVRDPHSATAHGAAGTQQWRAYGPQRVLQKIAVSESYWLVGTSVKQLGWVPTVNRRDDADANAENSPRVERGNRSESTDDGVYLYGGEEVWTNRQYVDYLLKKFCDESDDDGPAWTLTGQTDLLDRLTETIPTRTTQTVAELLSACIPRQLGLDWSVVPTDEGFAVAVYALSHVAYEFGGQTMPANPHELRLPLDGRPDVVQVRIVQSDERAYKKVRMLGSRVVVVGTLRCAEAIDAGLPTLIQGWTDELAEQYETDLLVAEAYPDIEARIASDLYRDMYSLLIVSENTDLEHEGWTPTLDGDGELTTSDQWQIDVRRTLEWTPLQAAIDYTAVPLDLGDPSATDFLPPQAYLRRYEEDEEIAGGVVDSPAHDVYIGADEAGFNVEAPRNTLGVRVIGSAPWELADNHLPAVVPDGVVPLYDWEATVATLAWETDQRFGLEYTAEDATPSDGVLEIEVPDAHLWVLAADTVVGCSMDGELQTRDTAVVLRQDNDRLLFALAGVLSRYYGARHRAEITVHDLAPWSGALGSILRAVGTDGATHEMAAPVTTITWTCSPDGTSTTTLSAGYAG
jgi:hypothetical protein